MKEISRLTFSFGTDPVVDRYLRARELSRAFASREIARRVVKAGWIKAVHQGKRYTIFLRVEVEAAQTRMERGEMPPPL
jgi:hypothetical protein